MQRQTTELLTKYGMLKRMNIYVVSHFTTRHNSSLFFNVKLCLTS